MIDRQLNEERCPVADSVLGQLYRSSPHGLAELIATISPDIRAMLAVYCYRRAHLASIGLAIAASCEEDDLAEHGGNLGSDMFAKSRAAGPAAENINNRRKKVSLASGTIRQMPPLTDEPDDAPEAAPPRAAYLKVVGQDLI